jgi:hypothetical protein
LKCGDARWCGDAVQEATAMLATDLI